MVVATEGYDNKKLHMSQLKVTHVTTEGYDSRRLHM